MADSNGFRTKFGGFHKDDVLAYIDSLQQEHGRQLAQVQQDADAQREAYEKALNDANQALAEQFESLQAERAEQDKLQQLVNEQYEVNRVLRERAETVEKAQADARALQEQVEALKREGAELRARLTAAETAQSELMQEKEAFTKSAARLQEAKGQALQAQQACTRLEEENRRYRQLVGDVGSFVVEVRAMGQRYLEEANSRCQGRLTAISNAIAALTEHLSAAAAELSAADDALAEQTSGAEQRLDELAREMERSADQLTAPPAESPSARFF